jgi:hypothetical protein
MAQARGFIGTLLLLGVIGVSARGLSLAIRQSTTPMGVLAQAATPTPASTMISPEVSTAQPSQAVVSPVSNIAESTTEPLTGAADDNSSGVSTGVIAGVAAGAAVLFAGIAFRLARGRTGAG